MRAGLLSRVAIHRFNGISLVCDKLKETSIGWMWIHSVHRDILFEQFVRPRTSRVSDHQKVILYMRHLDMLYCNAQPRENHETPSISILPPSRFLCNLASRLLPCIQRAALLSGIIELPNHNLTVNFCAQPFPQPDREFVCEDQSTGSFHCFQRYFEVLQTL